MKESDLEKKVISLEKDIEKIKTSQILGGNNTKVYRKYVEGRSTYVRFGGSQAFSNWYWYSEDGMSGGSQSSLYFANQEDNPFEIIEIEKVEIWRDATKLLSGWSSLVNVNTRGIGQRSSDGDLIQIKIGRATYVWQTGTPVGGVIKQGPLIMVDMKGGPAGCLTDNPATPFRYVFKFWLRSTSPGDFVCLNGR